MKTPIEVCEDIAGTITGGWHFVYGTRPDQNFDIDELDFTSKTGIIFLDPVKIKQKPNLTNAQIHECALALTFAVKQAIDATVADKKALQQSAFTASREFYLKLNQYEDAGNTTIVRDLLDKSVIPFENLFDLHLCGVLMETTIILMDTGSVCV